MKQDGSVIERTTPIHYRRRIVEELEVLVRSAMAAEATPDRSRAPRPVQSINGRIQEVVALKAAARRSALRKLQLVEAIGRLDDGSYGYCSSCAGLIEEERLNSDPCNALCAFCSRLRV